jgi:hypothetical protein
MNIALYIVLGLAVVGVVYVLARGVIGMANGANLDGRQSNKFMSYRVALQFIAVLAVLAIAFAARR